MKGFLHDVLHAPVIAVGVLAVFVVVGVQLMFVAAVLRLPREEPARETVLRALRATGAFGAFLTCAGALAFTQAAGRTFYPTLYKTFREVVGDMTGRTLLGALVAVCTPCAALLVARGKPRGEALGLVALASPVALAGLAVAWDAVRARAELTNGLAEHTRWVEYVRDLGELRVALTAVPWVAAAAAVVAVAIRSRGGTSWASVALGAAVLAAGAGALASTRGLAHDARSPVPYDETRVFAEWDGSPPGMLPVTRGPCEPYTTAPVLSFDHAGIPTLDGRAVTERELADDLASLHRSWSILHPAQPFVGRLHVVRGGGEEWLPLAAAISAARSAGYDTFDELVYSESRFRTRTRGVVKLRTLCERPLAP